MAIVHIVVFTITIHGLVRQKNQTKPDFGWCSVGVRKTYFLLLLFLVGACGHGENDIAILAIVFNASGIFLWHFIHIIYVNSNGIQFQIHTDTDTQPTEQIAVG